MFKQPIPLSADTHRDLRFSPDQPFDFARETVMIPLTASELFKAAREMTIVFPVHGGLPQALVGFEAGSNAYINDTGHWVGRYIPAHLRRYPFVLEEIPTTEPERAETGRRFGLQVDITAPHLNALGGHRLFDEQGQPTDILNRIQQILMQLQGDFERTQAMVAEIASLNLLVEQHLKINLPAGEPTVLSGFRLVDAKILAELAAERIAALHSTGALAMIYAHMISLTNLEDGWLAQKAKAHKPRTPKLDPDFDLEKFFGEKGDTFTFH